MQHGRNKTRPPVRTEFVLKTIWTRVEFERQYRGLTTTAACRVIAQTETSDGLGPFAVAGRGVRINIGDDHCKPDPETGTRKPRLAEWGKSKSIRRRYNDARALLAKRPDLREAWEFTLQVDLEVARTGREYAAVTRELKQAAR